MSNGWIKEGENFFLSPENIKRGWRLGKDALPDTDRYIVAYDYYDGPIYMIFYINKNRKYFYIGDWVEEDHNWDDEIIQNLPWKYFEGFANE
jgi:hypothetical protein